MANENDLATGLKVVLTVEGSFDGDATIHIEGLMFDENGSEPLDGKKVTVPEGVTSALFQGGEAIQKFAVGIALSVLKRTGDTEGASRLAVLGKALEIL